MQNPSKFRYTYDCGGNSSENLRYLPGAYKWRQSKEYYNNTSCESKFGTSNWGNYADCMNDWLRGRHSEAVNVSYYDGHVEKKKSGESKEAYDACK